LAGWSWLLSEKPYARANYLDIGILTDARSSRKLMAEKDDLALGLLSLGFTATASIT